VPGRARSPAPPLPPNGIGPGGEIALVRRPGRRRPGLLRAVQRRRRQPGRRCRRPAPDGGAEDGPDLRRAARVRMAPSGPRPTAAGRGPRGRRRRAAVRPSGRPRRIIGPGRRSPRIGPAGRQDEAMAGDRRPWPTRRGGSVSGPIGGPSDRIRDGRSPRRAHFPLGPYEHFRTRPAGGGGSGPDRSPARSSRGPVGGPPGRIRDGGSPRRAHLTLTLMRILGHGRRAGEDPGRTSHHAVGHGHRPSDPFDGSARPDIATSRRTPSFPIHACRSPSFSCRLSGGQTTADRPPGRPRSFSRPFPGGQMTATPPGGYAPMDMRAGWYRLDCMQS
jgi:hypothetical protein